MPNTVKPVKRANYRPLDISEVKKWLEGELSTNSNRLEIYGHDPVVLGRMECAESLLDFINTVEKDPEIREKLEWFNA